MTKESKYSNGWIDWEHTSGVKKMTRIQFWTWFKTQATTHEWMLGLWKETSIYETILDMANRKKVRDMQGLFQDAGLYASRFVSQENKTSGIKIVDEIIDLIKKGETPNSIAWNRGIERPKRKKVISKKSNPILIYKNLKYFPSEEVTKAYFNKHLHITLTALWEKQLDHSKKELSRFASRLRKMKAYNTLMEAVKDEFEKEYQYIQKPFARKDYLNAVISNGKKSELTIHQRLMPLLVKTHKGFIDLADAGAGKSNAVLNVIAQLNIKFSMIVAPASIVNNNQWMNYIKSAYVNPVIYTNKDALKRNFVKRVNSDRNEGKRIFYLISYTHVSISTGEAVLNRLKKVIRSNDLICLDEGQRTKIRDEVSPSKCRVKLEKFVNEIRSDKRAIKLLMLTGTPVPNTVTEAKSLVELVVGRKKEFSKITTKNTLQNMAKMQVELEMHGMRYKKQYKTKRGNIIKTPKIITVPCKGNYNLTGSVKSLANIEFLGMEQIALEVKLPYLIRELKRTNDKVIVFTKFVTGIVRRIAEELENNKITYTFYTGTNKSGLDANKEFYNGAQVLIASSAIAEGIDKLQNYCHRIWFVGQGWTYTEQQQAIGRVYRTGQKKPVEVKSFEATINGVPYDKIVKTNRINYKGKIHNMIANGEMPKDITEPNYTMKKIIKQLLISEKVHTKKMLPSALSKKIDKMTSAKLQRLKRKRFAKKKK